MVGAEVEDSVEAGEEVVSVTIVVVVVVVGGEGVVEGAEAGEEDVVVVVVSEVTSPILPLPLATGPAQTQGKFCIIIIMYMQQHKFVV